MDAVVWPDIRVGADVFAQHAGLLTANPAFLTDVFTSSTPTYVNILFIRFVSVRLYGMMGRQTQNQANFHFDHQT